MSTRLVEIMNNYFDDASPSPAYINGRIDRSLSTSPVDLPVKPKSYEWTMADNPRRLVRKYTFDSHDILRLYLIELLAYEADVQHYAKITISFPDVLIEVYTHDVNNVTELDHEYATAADEMYEDVLDGAQFVDTYDQSTTEFV